MNYFDSGDYISLRDEKPLNTMLEAGPTHEKDVDNDGERLRLRYRTMCCC